MSSHIGAQTVKVLEIVGDGRPSGGTTVILSLLEDLKALTDWDLHLVSQQGSYALDRAKRLGLQAHGIDFFRGRVNWRAVRELRTLLAAESPSLVHVHAARAGLPLSFALRADRAFPVVYTVHAYHFLQKGPILRRLGALAEKRCHRRADVSTFVSAFDIEIARQWNLLPATADVRLVYNGITPEDLPQPRTRRLDRICFLGNLVHQKHPELFVEMAAELRDQRLSFVMIGGGELEGTVQALVAKRGLGSCFELTGTVPRDQALEALNDCAVLVHTSRWDAPAIALLEAAQLEIPIVSSDAGGLPEFVEDGDTGLLVRERRPASFAAAVRRVLDDEALRARIVRGARERVHGQFLRSRASSEYRRLYEELLAARGGSIEHPGPNSP